MDCLAVSEILSAAHDGETVAPEALANARAHCETCPGCAAFDATLQRIARTPAPKAPLPLVDDIIETARATGGTEALGRALPEPTATGTAARPAKRLAGGFLPPWWQPRMTAFVSAAAVVLVGTVVALAVLGRAGLTGEQTEFSRDLESYTMEEAPSNPSGTDGASEDAAASSGPLTESVPATAVAAPPYVAWDGTVYLRSDGAPPMPSSAETAGVLVSDLGDPDGPEERTVLVDPDDPGTIFVRTGPDGVTGFARVVRTLGLREYSLVTDDAMQVFGTWPTLPSRFATPTAADGSPVFTRQGFDDRNVDVYVPEGGDMAEGFAVAPGTPADDPAAGNPYWTWWEPVP